MKIDWNTVTLEEIKAMGYSAPSPFELEDFWDQNDISPEREVELQQILNHLYEL